MNDKQFEFQWYSGTGKGGQHRNKHQNCCRCIHLPTGIRANGTQSRSREENKRNALAICKARIAASLYEEKERYQAGDERIRTYHEVDNRVTDHLSDFVQTYKHVVIKANIGEMIQARIQAKQG